MQENGHFRPNVHHFIYDSFNGVLKFTYIMSVISSHEIKRDLQHLIAHAISQHVIQQAYLTMCHIFSKILLQYFDKKKVLNMHEYKLS